MSNYGLPISKDNADQLFQNFKEIKTRSATSIYNAIKADIEALRYFNGNDVAYVFEKKSLEALIGRLKAEEDCIILFTGSRYDPEDKVNGRPTLIAFAYNVKEELGKMVARINVGAKTDTDDGFEHPGNFRIDLSVYDPIPSVIDLTGVTFVNKK